MRVRQLGGSVRHARAGYSCPAIADTPRLRRTASAPTSPSRRSSTNGSRDPRSPRRGRRRRGRETGLIMTSPLWGLGPQGSEWPCTAVFSTRRPDADATMHECEPDSAREGQQRRSQSALKLNFACSPKHPKFGCCARLRQPARFYAARSEIFPNSDRGPTGYRVQSYYSTRTNSGQGAESKESDDSVRPR
eukprot:COSAG01_NODE_1454_length_10256_cov_4.300748_6_plen_191_part_00